jgi:hypothetical protein
MPRKIHENGDKEEWAIATSLRRSSGKIIITEPGICS